MEEQIGVPWIPPPKKIREAKETEWIKRLRTVFPYDLNDKIGE